MNSSNRIMPAPELATALGIDQIELQHIAHEKRLPFAFSTAFGFFIQRRDFPQWKSAMEPKACCEGV